MSGQPQPVPDQFGEMLAALLGPGQAEAVAEVLERALELDDEQLAQFMAAATAIIRRSRRPLTAAELSELVPPPR